MSISTAAQEKPATQLFAAGIRQILPLPTGEKGPNRRKWGDTARSLTVDGASAIAGDFGILGDESPTVDCDLADPVLVELAARAADRVWGAGQPGERLTHRIGNKGFAFLGSLEGEAFNKSVLRVSASDGTSRGDIELRGVGHQTKYYGTLPSGKSYEYEDANGRGGIEKLIAYAPRRPKISRAQFLGEFKNTLAELLASDPRTRDRALRVDVAADTTLTLYRDRDALLAPSPELLAEAAAFVENREDDDRDVYRNTLTGFKGAGGEDARPLAEAYSERWAGGFNSPEYFAQTWESIEPRSLGWEFIRAKAHAGGWNDAPLDFEGDALAPESAAASTERPSYRLLRELIADPSLTAPPVPVIPRLAYRGRTVLYAAREKFGKSTIMSDAVVALSNGTPFLGEPCSKGVTLWCGEEHTGDVVRRFVDLGANPEAIYVLDLRAFGKNRIDEVCKAIEAIRPALVVIDTLISLTAGIVQDSSKDSQVTPHITRIAGLSARLDVACLLSHHATKSGSGYHGSMAYGALVDCILEMKAPGDDPKSPLRHISSNGRWRSDDFSLRFDPTLRTYALATARTPLERALLYIRANPGATKAQLLKDLNMRSEAVSRLRSELIASGEVRDVGVGGKWALELDPSRDFADVDDPIDGELAEGAPFVAKTTKAAKPKASPATVAPTIATPTVTTTTTPIMAPATAEEATAAMHAALRRGVHGAKCGELLRGYGVQHAFQLSAAQAGEFIAKLEVLA